MGGSRIINRLIIKWVSITFYSKDGLHSLRIVCLKLGEDLPRMRETSKCNSHYTVNATADGLTSLINSITGQ